MSKLIISEIDRVLGSWFKCPNCGREMIREGFTICMSCKKEVDWSFLNG